MLFTAVYKIASTGLKRNKGLNSMEGYYLNPGISWDIFPFKGGIHSSVWSTKTFLYNIKEPRYKQNYMGHKMSRNTEQSNYLEEIRDKR